MPRSAEYEIHWTAGNHWGVEYVEARTEAAALRACRTGLPLSCTAQKFATLTIAGVR